MSPSGRDPVKAVRAATAAELVDLSTDAAVVALSGGIDSCVLLHALRFPPHSSLEVTAAHFDHGMRPESPGDAAWVQGLCRAWRVELDSGRVGPSHPAPASEDAARSARYSFLRDVAERRDAVILTAHHADDQAETVLFRVLRGTGIEGLAGIPRRRVLTGNGPGDVVVLRPLLEVTRDDLEAYARSCRVPHRADPTNRRPDYARNVIRHDLLPRAEREVAPGARRALARLADIARDESAAWASAMRYVLPALDVRGVAAPSVPSGTDARPAVEPSCRRDALLDVGRPLGARVLRFLAAECGATLDYDTTRRAMAFIENSRSGRHIELGGGLELHLEAERVVLRGPSRTSTSTE